MTIQNIIDRILAYHPDIGDGRTCDTVIGSNPDVECTGILVAITPTLAVIRQAIDLGVNFIYVHEPTYYSGYDDEQEWLKESPVYQQKSALIEQYGLVIFRDHDHIHAHQPDGIFYYLFRQLGWIEHQIKPGSRDYSFRLPETTFGEILQKLKSELGAPAIRYIGNLDARVSTVWFCGHLLPSERTNWSNNEQVAQAWDYDVIIAGETVEWTLPLYLKDAALLGRNQGLIVPGHFILEEAGVRWTQEWLQPLVGDQVRISFMSAAHLFDTL